MPKPHFHIGIKNKVTADANDGTLELHFLDTIENKEVFDWGTWSVKTESLVSEVLNQLNATKPRKILQNVDSWGGDADAGKGVYNVVKNYGAKVETKILNKAASAATVIACAGSFISMPKNGFYVIHQASNSAEGTSKVLRQAADVADLYTDSYCEIYAQNNRKGKTKDDIKALIADGDFWMTGETACEMGFVDECYDDETINVTANIEAAKAQYLGLTIPASLQKITASLQQAEETNDLTSSQFNKLMKNFTEMVTALFSSKKVTAKVSADNTIDVTAAMQPIIVELAGNIQTEVTAEIEKVTGDVTTKVTAAMEEKYGQTIANLQQSNKDLKKTIDDLTADVTNIAGSESRPGAKKTEGKKAAKHFGEVE